jgi:truncated hemoglobin YjbI
MRFAIGEAERDQWLLCARKALDDLPVAANVREHVYTRLAATADHLRNDAGRGQPCRHDSLQSLSIQSAKAS